MWIFERWQFTLRGPNCTSYCLCPVEEFAAETGRSVYGVRGRWDELQKTAVFRCCFDGISRQATHSNEFHLEEIRFSPKFRPCQVPYVCLEEPLWTYLEGLASGMSQIFMIAPASLTQLKFAYEKYLKITPLHSQCICKLRWLHPLTCLPSWRCCFTATTGLRV